MVVVGSANILYRLDRDDARTALAEVLAAGPDLVGLQEWYVTRACLLRELGDVRLVPGPRLPAGRAPRYHWVSAIGGGNVVGARADRYDLVAAGARWLSRPGRSDRPDRRFGVEPPREATYAVLADRVAGGTAAIISYHLVPGVEARGGYRADRPLLTDRHRSEVRRLEQLVADLQQAGHVVHAVGDANYDRLRLAGLTSAWEGREELPGTIGKGRRTIDDVHGPGRATDVRLVTTPSDHRAVLATRP